MRDLVVLNIGYWKYSFIALNASKYGTLICFIFCFIFLCIDLECSFCIRYKYLWFYACAFGWLCLKPNYLIGILTLFFPIMFNFPLQLSNFRVGFVFVCSDKQNKYTNWFWMWIVNGVQLNWRIFHDIISKDNR